jgi:hypothetical protein
VSCCCVQRPSSLEIAIPEILQRFNEPLAGTDNQTLLQKRAEEDVIINACHYVNIYLAMPRSCEDVAIPYQVVLLQASFFLQDHFVAGKKAILC